MLRNLPSTNIYVVSEADYITHGEEIAPVVLVVDDDADIRETLSDTLGLEGYAVMCARHGAEALEVLRHSNVDLIVLDLMMPVMDGNSFIAAKNRDPTIAPLPILAMTAASQPQVEGATMFMRKPFQIDSFLTAVSRCLAEN